MNYKNVDIENHKRSYMQLTNDELQSAWHAIQEEDNNLLSRFPAARGLVDTPRWIALQKVMIERRLSFT